jgi:hypothetical protein
MIAKNCSNILILYTLLPIDILKIIYIKLCQNNAYAIILKNVKQRITKKYTIRYIFIKFIQVNSISHITYNDIEFLINSVINLEIIDNLNYLYINNFRLSRSFWIDFLNILSIKLNIIRNYLSITNKINNEKSKIYYNYKKFYTIWFNICKKYNIKLFIIKRSRFSLSSNYKTISLTSRNINKIKSFNNLFAFPRILDDNYELIDYNTSFNNLI